MEAQRKDIIEVGQYISVKVENLLPDLILVSFQHPNNILFQGILLDSTKGTLPCGIYSWKNDLDPLKDDLKVSGISMDKFYTVKQRHTYQNIGCESGSSQRYLPKPISINKSKHARMTVRLRPRQVLCSKCKSICNEKLENIGPGRNVKPVEANSSSQGNYHHNNSGKLRESRSVRETRQSALASKLHVDSGTSKNMSPTHSAVLVPKLIKLKASDIETATNFATRSVGNDDTPSQMELSSMEEPENCKYKDKLPTLKLSSASTGMPWKKRKGQIPKMTILASIVQATNGDQKKECSIRTRSRGSMEEKVLTLPSDPLTKYPGVPKVVLSSTQYQTEGNDNVKDMSMTANIRSYQESDEGCNNNVPYNSSIDLDTTTTASVSEKPVLVSLPKVTILPVTNFECSDCSQKSEKTEKMNLRKKRSIGSMEDLWDETVFEETNMVEENKDDKIESSECLEDSESGMDNEKPKTTPVLKISFGPGKGTVLKIPAKSTVSDGSPNETEEQVESPKKLLISKAARKALKRARKEAQKKCSGGISPPILINAKAKFGGRSPLRLGGMSPARLSGFSPGRFGGVSPGRFGGASPGRFGGASPGRFGGASPLGIVMPSRPGMEGFLRSQTRKHKHKVKHKKKHKEDRKHKSSDENAEPNNFSTEVPSCKEESEPLSETTNVNVDFLPEKNSDSTWKHPESPNTPPHSPSSPKQSCLNSTRHKLSISIKRVNNASYVACDSSAQNEDTTEGLQTQSPNKFNVDDAPVIEEKLSCTKPMGLNYNFLNISPDRDAGSDQSLSSDESWDIPDFPCIVTDQQQFSDKDTLMLMKLAWQDVDNCPAASGEIKVGDIVWGKIREFPWWPAKVACLKSLEESCHGGQTCQQAQVNWYGTSSTSIIPMQTLQPFLKNFHTIFNKRKRGPYLEAVQQASCDAQQSREMTDQAINICESPITASPREVDVVS